MLNFSIVIILSILLGIIVLSVQMHSSMKRKEMEALASTLRTGVEQVDDQISNVTDSLLSLRDELSSSGKRFIGRYDANTLNDTRNRLHTIVSHNSLIEEIGLVYPLDGSTEEEITQSLQALLNEVPQHFAAQVLAAPGGLCTSINTVGLLFEHGQMNYYASVENHTPGEPILHPETTDDDEQLRLRSLLLLHQHLAAGDAENAVAALETFYACPLDAQLIDLRERYSTLKTQILLSAWEAAPQCQVPPLPWFSCFGGDPTKPLLALTDAARAVADAVAKQQSTDVQDDQCRRLMEYLQKNYADSSLCATVMADEFRVSEKYLFTLFKKKTGHSPIRYLHSIRMKQAAELLCEDKMTVQQVCEAVGIPNLGTFQKAFKREYGVAPSRYREYALRSSR